MSSLNSKVKYKKSSKSKDSFGIISGRKQKPEPMGLPRVIGTVCALILGILITHTSLHYLLPFASSKQILGISPHNYAAAALKDTQDTRIKNAILRPFEIRRSYLRSHQGIRAHYVVPPGTVAEIKIEHCKRALIVEVYRCKVTGSSTAKLTEGSGARGFKFNQAGFYVFKDQLRDLSTGEIVPKSKHKKYRIIWKRS